MALFGTAEAVPSYKAPSSRFSAGEKKIKSQILCFQRNRSRFACKFLKRNGFRANSFYSVTYGRRCAGGALVRDSGFYLASFAEIPCNLGAGMEWLVLRGLRGFVEGGELDNGREVSR